VESLGTVRIDELFFPDCDLRPTEGEVGSWSTVETRRSPRVSMKAMRVGGA
jgi:hypothetical protein